MLPSLLQSQILHSRLQVEQGSLLLLLLGSAFQTQLAGIIGTLLPMLLLVMLDNRFQSLLLLLSSRIVVEVMLPTLDATTRRSLSFDRLFGTSRRRLPHHHGPTFLVYSTSKHVIIVIVHLVMMFMILSQNRCFFLLEGHDIDTFAPQPSESSQLLIVIATGCISTLRGITSISTCGSGQDAIQSSPGFPVGQARSSTLIFFDASARSRNSTVITVPSKVWKSWDSRGGSFFSFVVGVSRHR